MKGSVLSKHLLVFFILICYPFTISWSAYYEKETLPVHKDNSEIIHIYSAQSSSTTEILNAQAFKEIQEPVDTITKEEKRQLRKERRAERRAQMRAENMERMKVDNPNNADYIILGKDLPSGYSILQALDGRIPGVVISEEGYVMAHGPQSFNAGQTALFLVDGLQVDREFVRGMRVGEVGRVEVFTGPSAAMYGTRVGTAVISIFTINSMNEVRPGEE